MERLRRRSSRSPTGRRHSPRRRSHTRSRSLEKRARKRSPFINELARQLRNEAMMPTGMVNSGGGYAPPSATVEGIAPLLNAPVYQQDGKSRPPPQSQPASPSVTSFHAHQANPLPPPPPPILSMPLPAGLPFMGFESMSAMPPMSFHEPMAPCPIAATEYTSGPVMYNQSNSSTAPVQQPPSLQVVRPPLLSAPVSVSVSSPQPVPAPVMDHMQMPYKALHVTVPAVQTTLLHQFEDTTNSKSTTSQATSATSSSSSQIYKERGSGTTPYNADFHAPREERLKTPEPPIISKPKVIAIRTIVMTSNLQFLLQTRRDAFIVEYRRVLIILASICHVKHLFEL